MPTRENAMIAALERVADPVERAAACQQFITNGRATIKLAQQVRDEAIRTARTNLHPEAKTVDKLAERIKAKRNVVVDALRIRSAA
ncbi:hypothetical protein [Micromonospora carbonacea]|uniref:hypothetical protein n=1 Tax=Micromonospora carbonacea TaxID=47853 RepID=UPI00114CD2E4|nr:hypothetical protein [Micromonospora carbonacea]